MKSRIVTLVLTTLFLGVMFGGFFHSPSGMEMAGEMNSTGCPLMVHKETVCPMNVLEHVKAWKDTFLATIPVFAGFFAMVSLLLAVISLAPNIILSRLYFVERSLGCIHKRIDNFIHRFWQELFSSGILNPKLF